MECRNLAAKNRSAPPSGVGEHFGSRLYAADSNLLSNKLTYSSTPFAAITRKRDVNPLKHATMNKVAILSTSLLLTFAAVQVDAQSADRKAAKEAGKELMQQPTKRTQVNLSSKRQFIFEFGRISGALWSTTDYYDRVFFTKGGQKLTAFYDREAKLVCTSTPKVFTDLPLRAQGIIKSTYTDYEVTSVCFLDYKAAHGGVRYYGRILYNDNYFVALTKEASKVLLRVDTNGTVFLFKQL
jgi:hypothetical protein